MMKTSINLLPFAYRRRALVRSRLLRWSVVWIVLGAIGIGVGTLKQSRCNRALLAMEDSQRNYAPLETFIRERDSMRNELNRLHAKGTILGQLRDQKPMLTLMGAVSESARRCDGRLFVRDMRFARRETADKPDNRRREDSRKKSDQQTTAEKVQPWASVTLEGNALNNLAIATFAAGLRDTGLFQRVELKSSVGVESADTAVHSFIVECEI